MAAIDWLVNELTKIGYLVAPHFGHPIIDKKIAEAKEMEKQGALDLLLDFQFFLSERDLITDFDSCFEDNAKIFLFEKSIQSLKSKQ